MGGTLSKESESYILGGSTLVLSQFNKMKDLVPIPYVGTALDVVQGIVDILKTIRDNREKCRALLADLGRLMVVVLRPLVGLKSVPDELRENLSTLTDHLLKIKETLELFRKAPWYDKFIRSQDRKDALVESSEKMKTALTMFNVAQQIDAALTADALKAQVEEVQLGVTSVGDKVDLVVGTTEAIATDVQVIRAAVTLKTTITAVSPELASTALPPEPQIIFGRDEEIKKIVERLCTTDDGRFVIRGPGGIGKTTIVHAVAHHRSVVDKYGDRRKWVPCAEATAPELLLELVARSIGVTADSPGQDRKEKIVNVLRSSFSRDSPSLIICDNFETPWDTVGGQSDVADILQTVTSVPGVSLLLTMRGHTPPAAGRVAWSEPQLEPLSTLSLDASRELYLKIHGEASEDPHLDELLLKLSYMPLAVRLAATYGSDGGVMPGALAKRWESRTIIKALDHSDERTESVAFSVKLSIQSNAMKRTPEALTLLTILAHLPGGARREFIPQFAPFDEDLVADAIAALSKVSLIQTQGPAGLITMLSPVRTVVLEAHPIDEQHRAKLLSAYYDLIEGHSSGPSDPNHIHNMSLLRTEHVNCETLLRSMLETTPSEYSIEATYKFAIYLYWTFPDTALISMAVDKARSLQSDRKSQILAEGLFQLGRNQMLCNMYLASEATFKEAATIYEQMGNVKGQAYALDSLCSAYRMLKRYNDAVSAGEQARDLFRQIGSVIGEANAIGSLGDAYCVLRQYNDAVSAAERARDLHRQVGNVLGEANTFQSLGNVYRMLRQYSDMVSAAERARDLCRQIGDVHGEANAILSLVVAYGMLSQYNDAVSAAQQARDLFRQIGNVLGEANAVWGLGDAYHGLRRYNDAVDAAEQARDLYKQIGNVRGEASGLQCLGNAYRQMDRFEDGIQAGQQALSLFIKIGDQLGVGNASWSLALALEKQGKLDEALASARSALESFTRIGLDREIGIVKRLIAKIEAGKAEGGPGETEGRIVAQV